MSYYLIINPSFWEDQVEDKQLYEYLKFKDYSKRSLMISSQSEIFKFSQHKLIGVTNSKLSKLCDTRQVPILKILSSDKSIFYIKCIDYDKLGPACNTFDKLKVNRGQPEKEDKTIVQSSLNEKPLIVSKSKISTPVNKSGSHRNCLCMINTESKMGWLLLKKTNENECGYKLKESDFLKMGRITFKIRETKYSMKMRTECKVSRVDEHKLLSTKLVNATPNLVSMCRNISSKDNADQNYLFVTKKLNMTTENKSDILMLNSNFRQSELQHRTIAQNTLIDNSQVISQADSSNSVYMKESLKSKLLQSKVSLKKQHSLNTCRICLLEEIDEDDPLINPCKCQGSVGFIHIECLKRWLDSKLVTKVYAYLIVHSFKDLKCEICNSLLPERIFFKGKIKYLINLQLPETDDYIILETISEEKKEIKFLYIIHMPPKTELLMGRSVECDIRMTDISISRIHAFLENVDGQFYIKDNKSKFGSLIKVQSELLILPHKNLTIQFDECLLSISLRAKLCTKLCSKANRFLSSYNDYNEYFSTKENRNDCSIILVQGSNDKNAEVDRGFIDDSFDNKELEMQSANSKVINFVSTNNQNASGLCASIGEEKQSRNDNQMFEEITIINPNKNEKGSLNNEKGKIKSERFSSNHSLNCLKSDVNEYSLHDSNNLNSHKSLLNTKQLSSKRNSKDLRQNHNQNKSTSNSNAELLFNKGLRLNSGLKAEKKVTSMKSQKISILDNKVESKITEANKNGYSLNDKNSARPDKGKCNSPSGKVAPKKDPFQCEESMIESPLSRNSNFVKCSNSNGGTKNMQENKNIGDSSEGSVKADCSDLSQNSKAWNSSYSLIK